MRLPRPNQEQARKALALTSFEHRLMGFRLHRRLGPVPVALYSLAEAVAFLEDVYAQVDFQELEIWASKALSDPDLAREIARLAAEGSNQLQKTQRIRRLLEARLRQCRKLA